MLAWDSIQRWRRSHSMCAIYEWFSPHSVDESALAFRCALEMGFSEKLLAVEMPNQVELYMAGSFSCPDMSLDLRLGIHEKSCFRGSLKPSNFLTAAKVWTLSCTISWLEARNTILDICLFNIWPEKRNYKITTKPSPSPIRCCVVLMIAQVKGKFSADGKVLVKFVQLTACWNLNSGVLLQVVFLHIQKRVAGPVLSFFTRFEAALHCLRRYCHMLKNNEMNNHLHHHSDDIPKLNKISICEYTNLALHQLYVETFESGSWSVGYAARNLKHINKNHFSCVNQWNKDAMIVTSLQHHYVGTQKNSTNGRPIVVNEQAYLICYCRTRSRSSFIDGTHSEDIVPWLFGLCHRRWTTVPSLLILRLNRGDPLSLSSVKDIQYLQLNAYKPQVHTPDRPLGESPAGHQLVWSINEAFEDCNCRKIEPVVGQTTAV